MQVFTEFICMGKVGSSDEFFSSFSVRLDLVTDPTMAIINGDTVVATGPGGMNAFVKLKCRESDKVSAKCIFGAESILLLLLK